MRESEARSFKGGGQLCDCGGVANVQSEARSAEELQRRGLKGKPIESPRRCHGGTKGGVAV